MISTALLIKSVSLYEQMHLYVCIRARDPYTGEAGTCGDQRDKSWTREKQITLQEKPPPSSSQHGKFPPLFLIQM